LPELEEEPEVDAATLGFGSGCFMFDVCVESGTLTY